MRNGAQPEPERVEYFWWMIIQVGLYDAIIMLYASRNSCFVFWGFLGLATRDSMGQCHFFIDSWDTCDSHSHLLAFNTLGSRPSRKIDSSIQQESKWISMEHLWNV